MSKELYAQLDREHPETFLVLADALQQRGDPRGELIVVQRALESASIQDSAELRRREGEVLTANTEKWLPIEPGQRKRIAVRWRDGFVDRARVVGDTAALASLLDAPHVSATLTELQLVDPHSNSNELLAVLCDAWPSALRKLGLNDRVFVHGPTVDLRALGKHAEHLEALTVRGLLVDFGWATPALRRLELHATNLDWSSYGTFEGVEQLVIWTGEIDLDELWRFPNVRSLGLCGTRNTDELARRLVQWSRIGELHELSLDGGTLTVEGAGVLAALALPIDRRRNLIAGELEQRTGERALNDPAEAASLRSRLDTLTRAEPKPEDAERHYKKIKDVAALLELGTAVRKRVEFAELIPEPHTRREAIYEVVVEAEAVLEIDRTTAGTLLVLGNECDGLDELFEAEAWIWQALRDARWYDDEATENRAAGQIATLRMRRGDPNTAAPILDRVQARFRTSKNRSNEAWAIRQRGNVELTRSDFKAAEVLYRKALAIYEELDDKPSQGIVLSELSSAYWARADYAGAEQMLRRAIELKSTDTVGLGSTYYNLAAILNGANRVDEATEAANTSLEIFEAHNHQGGQGQALSLLGELRQRKNDHDGAMKLLDRAIKIFRAGGRKRELGVALGNVSRVALDRGEWATARAACEEAVECHREVGNKYNEGMQLMGLGDAAIGERDFAAAERFLVEALAPLEAMNNFTGIAAVHHRRGIAAQLAGDPALARDHYSQAMADATRGNWRELHGWTEMWIALIHAQATEPIEARAALERSRAALPKTSVQGNETFEMARSVVSKLLGGQVKLPVAASWDSRIIRTLVAD